MKLFSLRSVDALSLRARRPVTCSRDHEMSCNERVLCSYKNRLGSREQVAGRRNSDCQQVLSLLLILLFLSTTIITNAFADELAQANNPLADMTALNFQNYYYPEISGLSQTGDTFWIRYAQPIDKFLLRASMPFTSYPISPSMKKSGSGDFNAFAAYLLDTGNPAVSAGIGPLVVAPTAKPSTLGAGKWQGGLAAVYFNASSTKIQYGGLVTYQTDLPVLKIEHIPVLWRFNRLDFYN